MMLLLSLFILSGCTLLQSESSVVLNPIYKNLYSCTEHYQGQFSQLGDALGVDCWIQKLENVNGKIWLRSYKNDGLENKDWFGWNQPVLAPISGIVENINLNPKENVPGVMGTGSASFIIIKGKNNLHVLLAHIQSPYVAVGDKVEQAQPIARVGNNGQSRHPHIHIGAWIDRSAVQIRFDQSQIPHP